MFRDIAFMAAGAVITKSVDFIFDLFKEWRAAKKEQAEKEEQERKYQSICEDAIKQVNLTWFEIIVTNSNETLKRGIYDEVDAVLYLVQGVRRTLRYKLRRKKSGEDHSMEAHQLLQTTLDEDYPISWWFDTDAWQCFFDSLSHYEELALRLTTALQTLGYVERRLKCAISKIDNPSL